MIQFYGYKNCSTCRKAEAYLKDKGVSYSYIDITQEPPSAEELQAWLAASALTPKQCLNTSGEVYRTLGLKDKLPTLSSEALVQLLASNGRLIKRPLLSDGRRMTLGFKAEVFATWA